MAGSAGGEGFGSRPARYDPVMLLTAWMYIYLRGVVATRGVEDRCRYDATFRVACGREIPGTDLLEEVVMNLPVMERNAKLPASGVPGPEWLAFCRRRIAELTGRALQASRSACA